MTAASPDHSHHCSCPKLPPDLWARIQSAYLRYGEVFCREMLRVVTGSRDHRSPAFSNHRPRFLDKVTPPDVSGHQYYTGSYPRWGIPRVMFQGRTLDIPQWLWLWNQLDGFTSLDSDEHLVRTCRDPRCVSPDHHRLPDAPRERLGDAYANSRDLLAWEALNPRPHNPRSVAWLQGIDFKGERCQAMHQIKVYSVRPRKSYCAECAAIMRKWESDRKDVIRRVESRMTGLPPRVPNQPQLPPVYEPSPEPEPELELEPEDTLVGKVQRM